jgi:hypothetical protein
MSQLRSSAFGALAALCLAATPALGQDEAAAIEFGDDASVWARDGECDDPRFEGRGMARGSLQDGDRGHDAADCRAALEAGRIALRDDEEATVELTVKAPPAIEVVDLDYGDDSGVWPNDGECDDPRFSGEGMAQNPRRVNVRTDATDCRDMVEAGRAVYTGEVEPLFEGAFDGVDFGDNEGSYPDDGECDDPRFVGDNVAPSAARANARHDAHDCRAAHDAGEASYVGELAPLFEGAEDGVDFGDNSGPYADDEECDDPRFSGEAVAAGAQRINIRRDAHDCHEAVGAARASYDGELAPLFTGEFEGVDLGDNAGPYPEDRECDDPRFRGFGMASPPWNADSEGHDAEDCHWLLSRGFIRYVLADGLFEGSANNVDFGDNSGAFVNDGECDDSRFEGPGIGISDGANDRTDAMDCWLNLQDGSIRLKQP